jgi:hypothetical protein
VEPKKFSKLSSLWKSLTLNKPALICNPKNGRLEPHKWPLILWVHRPPAKLALTEQSLRLNRFPLEIQGKEGLGVTSCDLVLKTSQRTNPTSSLDHATLYETVDLGLVKGPCPHLSSGSMRFKSPTSGQFPRLMVCFVPHLLLKS